MTTVPVNALQRKIMNLLDSLFPLMLELGLRPIEIVQDKEYDLFTVVCWDTISREYINLEFTSVYALYWDGTVRHSETALYEAISGYKLEEKYQNNFWEELDWLSCF